MSNFKLSNMEMAEDTGITGPELGKAQNVANINKNSTWICFKHLFTETAYHVNTSRTHVPLDGLCS